MKRLLIALCLLLLPAGISAKTVKFVYDRMPTTAELESDRVGKEADEVIFLVVKPENETKLLETLIDNKGWIEWKIEIPENKISCTVIIEPRGTAMINAEYMLKISNKARVIK